MSKFEIENVTIVKETDKAVLVTIDGENHWIPQSQIHDDSEVWQAGDTGTLVISEWLARQKGFI